MIGVTNNMFSDEYRNFDQFSTDHSEESQQGKSVTERWAEHTKHCKRNLVVRKVALAALAVAGAALVGIGIALISAATGGAVLPAVVLTGAIFADMGMLTTISALFTGALLDWKDYSDPKTAREAIQEFEEIDFKTFSEDRSRWRVRKQIQTYTEYGFISKQDGESLLALQREVATIAKNSSLLDGDVNDKLHQLENLKSEFDELKGRIQAELSELEGYLASPHEEDSSALEELYDLDLTRVQVHSPQGKKEGITLEEQHDPETTQMKDDFPQQDE